MKQSFIRLLVVVILFGVRLNSASKFTKSDSASSTSSVLQLLEPRSRTEIAASKCRLEDFPKFAAAREKIHSAGIKETMQKKGFASLLEPIGSPPIAFNELPPQRKIGASVAVHPPKFWAVAMFLHDWMKCPGAFEAMNVYLVFSHQKDLDLFREAMNCISPDFPELWTPVVAQTPEHGWPGNFQNLAAFKKYYGLAAMMDIGKEEYGLMLDAEVVVYDFHARAKTGHACSSGGAWSKLFDRIKSMELKKVWPAARVSAKLSTYDFGGGNVMSGRDYDKALLEENAYFVNGRKDMSHCTYAACKKVSRQIDDVLFSWWTELPWLNLTIAKNMFASMMGEEVKQVKSWRETARGIRFPRFEYVAYQMWTVLHDGWDFLDVSDTTLEAKWGSYLEDPQLGSRLAELKPMWTSADALGRVEDGSVPAFSEVDPPLLIFHLDHLMEKYAEPAYKELWKELLLELLKRDKRKDYDEGTLA